MERRGASDTNRWYLTTSLLVEYQQWNLSVSNTARTTRVSGGGGILNDNLVTVSGGYTFENGIGVSLGYSFRNEDDFHTHTFGVLLSYEFEYTLGRKKTQ